MRLVLMHCSIKEFYIIIYEIFKVVSIKIKYVYWHDNILLNIHIKYFYINNILKLEFNFYILTV